MHSLLVIEIMVRHFRTRIRNEVVIVHSGLTHNASELDPITNVSEEQLLRIRYFAHRRFGAVLEPLNMSPLIFAIYVNDFRKPECMN
jgi:hypothetical protein